MRSAFFWRQSAFDLMLVVMGEKVGGIAVNGDCACFAQH